MKRSYRQMMVDGSPIGLQGLDETLAALREEGRTPQDAGLGFEIVERVGRDNYIPFSAREAFAAAFTREYAAFLARARATVPGAVIPVSRSPGTRPSTRTSATAAAPA